MKKHKILIGYMGCGKSTVGRSMAARQKVSFLDTDAWIEEKEGMSVSEIFAVKGEMYFRDLETECLKELLYGLEEGSDRKEVDFETMEKKNMESGKEYVISVGGGLPVRNVNRDLLKQLGEVIYLKAKPETIYERLKGDTTRPLLQTKDPLARIQEMIVAREEKYQAAAHKVICVDGKRIEEIVEEILDRKSKKN